MTRRFVLPLCAVAAAASVLAGCGAMRSGMGASPMSFFITSANPGKGGDFGGLAGADIFGQRARSICARQLGDPRG